MSEMEEISNVDIHTVANHNNVFISFVRTYVNIDTTYHNGMNSTKTGKNQA